MDYLDLDDYGMDEIDEIDDDIVDGMLDLVIKDSNNNTNNDESSIINSDDEYIFELQSIQASVFRNLFDALKDILPEANIIFDKEGMKIYSLNANHNVLVDMKLNSKFFEEYKCRRNVISVGLSLITLNKLLKSISNTDNIRFFIENGNENKFGVCIDNTVRQVKNTYKIDTLEIDTEQYPFPDINYNIMLKISTCDLQTLCRNNQNVNSEDIEIKKVDNELIFTCRGNVENVTVYKDDKRLNKQRMKECSNIGIESGVIFIQNNEDVYQGEFKLKPFSQFTKCRNLCLNAKLELENDQPLKLTYKVGNMGYIKFILVQNINE